MKIWMVPRSSNTSFLFVQQRQQQLNKLKRKQNKMMMKNMNNRNTLLKKFSKNQNKKNASLQLGLFSNGLPTSFTLLFANSLATINSAPTKLVIKSRRNTNNKLNPKIGP